MSHDEIAIAQAYEKAKQYYAIAVIVAHGYQASHLCRLFVEAHPEFRISDPRVARHGARKVNFEVAEDIELIADAKNRTFRTRRCADTHDQLVIHESVWERAAAEQEGGK